MTHLAEERILELSRPGAGSTEEERSHLAQCEACRDNLAQELDFALVAVQLAQPVPRPELALRTVERFSDAAKARREATRRLATLVVAALTLCLICLLAMPAVTLVTGVLLFSGTSLLSGAVAFLHALGLLLVRVPALPAATLVMMMLALLGSALVLGRLTRLVSASPALAK